jgi:hypothetical protein
MALIHITSAAVLWFYPMENEIMENLNIFCPSDGTDLREFINRLKEYQRIKGTTAKSPAVQPFKHPQFHLAKKFGIVPRSSSFELCHPVDVVIQEVVSPNKFFVTLASDAAALDGLMKRLGNFYENAFMTGNCDVPFNFDGWLGLVCAAMFSDGKWHRGQVKREIGHNEVEVLFVDFGTTSIVLKKFICFIDKSFTSIPAFAVEARLSGCVRTPSDDTSPEVTHKFFSLLQKSHIQPIPGFQNCATSIVESIWGDGVSLDIITHTGQWVSEIMIADGMALPQEENVLPLVKLSIKTVNKLAIVQTALIKRLFKVSQLCDHSDGQVRRLIKAQFVQEHNLLQWLSKH